MIPSAHSTGTSRLEEESSKEKWHHRGLQRPFRSKGPTSTTIQNTTGTRGEPVGSSPTTRRALQRLRERR